MAQAHPDGFKIMLNTSTLQAMKIFAVVNGEILEDLGNNTTPTYTRIHFLINELKKFDDVEIISIRYRLLPRVGLGSILYNNAIKTSVALRSAGRLIRYRPLAYFSYPHSLITVQNRALFYLCKILDLKVILDIHDSIEQANAVGTGKSRLNAANERYFFRESKLLFPSMDGELWKKLLREYEIPSSKKIIYLPNAFDEEFISCYPEPYKSKSDRFNICYIGGITKNRGIRLLVNACSELKRRYPQIRLFLFGAYGDSVPEEIKEIISKSDFITMKQIPRKDIPRSLMEIDLLVMPYNPHEIYMNSITPTKFFEYIGTGKPILCTKCEPLIEIGSDSSIMYVDYELDDFKSKIEMLIRDPNLREEMSKKLIKLRKKHTWKDRAKRVHDALMDL